MLRLITSIPWSSVAGLSDEDHEEIVDNSAEFFLDETAEVPVDNVAEIAPDLIQLPSKSEQVLYQTRTISLEMRSSLT